MGGLDRLYEQPSEPISFRSDTNEGLLRFPGLTSGYGAALELVNQAVDVIRGLENKASEAQRASYEKLQQAEKRIEELEADLRSAQSCIDEARRKLKQSNEAASLEKSRLEKAERKICALEMRARTAEAQANENASILAQLEEAIRTQLLAKRSPPNKLTRSH
jgi:chromosome segregation ATPase